MKKLWVALAMMLVLLCWGSAGAYEGWCSNCGYTIEKTVTDMGSYHQIMCTGCGYTYEENHMGLCKDFSCYYCGSTNSEGATIGHSWSLTKDSGDGKHHYQECKECGEINEGTHTVWCGENACGVCGSTNVGEANKTHSYREVDLGDGKHHQSMCITCGETAGEPYEHRVWCTKPGVCINCESTNVEGITLEHYNTQVVDQGDGTHQTQCVSCGEKLGVAWSHYASCVDGYCYECGSYDVEVDHDTVWMDCGDGKTHASECVNCGEVFWVENHSVNCKEPGVCYMCGSTNVGGVGIGHYTSSIKYVDLGKKHQQQCTDCGYKWAADWHWAYCNDTTTCRICKLTGLTLPSDQYTHRGTFTDLGASHRFTCNYCDYTETESHWVYCTDQSECYQCGATGFEINWENRYCQGPITYLSYDATNHTFSCGACKQTYTEPHGFDDDGSCSCGYVKAAAGLPGDADNNSRVTLNDAIAILEGTVSNDANADVNGDGKTDLNDALRILQYLAGWNVSLQ